MRIPRTALCLIALCLPIGLQAQQATALVIPRIEAAMQADGKMDEPFWQQAAVQDLPYEIGPGDNIPAHFL